MLRRLEHWRKSVHCEVDSLIETSRLHLDREPTRLPTLERISTLTKKATQTPGILTVRQESEFDQTKGVPRLKLKYPN
jgi:hypothetical protein